MNYAAELLYKKTAKPKNYWANTSGNGIIRDFGKQREYDVSGKFETLMNGGTIFQTISDELTYDTVHETEDNLWSVLLMTGYLTKADPEEDGNTVSRALVIDAKKSNSEGQMEADCTDALGQIKKKRQESIYIDYEYSIKE